MTTYTQRQQLEQQAQQWAKKVKFWRGIEDTCVILAGIVSLVLLVTAYKGV
jgi:hypothetical protein